MATTLERVRIRISVRSLSAGLTVTKEYGMAWYRRQGRGIQRSRIDTVINRYRSFVLKVSGLVKFT